MSERRQAARSAASLSLFTTMVRIRAFEERVARHFRRGDIHGFVHVSLGQEAVAAGACAPLQADDFITTTHRGHGHCIAKGADPTEMMAELFGRATGLCRGKGGSMHLADPRLGILGANGVVGAGVPLAAGAALAAQVRGSGQLAVAFFGEGALHTGAFHEGVSLAVAWKLPLVLICERNGFAEFTATSAWGGPEPAERAGSYGLAASAVDGCDVFLVRDAVVAAVEAARAGSGPQFIEARTTRLGGHYEGDPQSYRTSSEPADVRDPLAQARGAVDAAEADRAERAAHAEMDRAVEVALQAPYPQAAGALEDVYA